MTTLNAQAVALVVLVLAAGCIGPTSSTPNDPATTTPSDVTVVGDDLSPRTSTVELVDSNATTTPTTTPGEPTVSSVQWRELPSALASVTVRHDDNQTKIVQELNPHQGALRIQMFNASGWDWELENIKKPTNYTAHYVERGDLVAYTQIRNNSRRLLLAGIVTNDSITWLSDHAEYDDVSRDRALQEAANVSVRFSAPEDPSNDYRVETEGAPNGTQIIVEQWSTVGNGDDWFVHAVEPTADSHITDEDYIRVYYAHGDERVHLGTYDPHNVTEGDW